MYEPEEDYYEPVKTINAFNNYYIEYESKGDKDKILSLKEYLDMIKQYLSRIINDHKTPNEWKIQLTMKTDFISSKDCKETHTMHTTSDNIESMIGNERNEIIKEHFESLLQKYQEGLEKSMKGSEFVFDNIDLLYYKLHKIGLNAGGSCMHSPSGYKTKTQQQIQSLEMMINAFNLL